MSAAETKSYLPPGLAVFSPWATKGTSSKASSSSSMAEAADSQPQGRDHVVSHRHRLSLKEYPPDCPPLKVRWFYAVDVPKRKPFLTKSRSAKDEKPPSPPKKFVAFSAKDSRSVEQGYQRLATEEDAGLKGSWAGENSPASGDFAHLPGLGQPANAKVPVNEDYLFDVDVPARELSPAYWLGPIYEVRRGTWFYQEGSTLRPCDENLATQLEEGYLKVKPFRQQTQIRSASQPRPVAGDSELAGEPPKLAPKRSADSLRVDVSDQRARSPSAREVDAASPQVPTQPQRQTHRLFGAHMNSVVTYQDAKTAWILTDDFLSRMSTTVYQRIVGGGYLGGIKVVRGYSEIKKIKDAKTDSQKKANDAGEPGEVTPPGREKVPEEPRSSSPELSSSGATAAGPKPSESHIRALERQVSDLVSSAETKDPQQQEEEARKREEQEIREDYREDEGEEQGREIEHLILVTHGIGQRLGLRMESVNFVHDVNVLRKTLKSVYQSSPEIQALNSDDGKATKNCRLQVLPVCWRHLLDFPKQGARQNRKEHDLADLASSDDEVAYPSLEDITVEGVPAVRNLITDLALDVLLYQSAYRGHISRIVQRECNRIYGLFLARNPGFKGKVSLIGHSLGSAIFFDVLCQQSEDLDDGPSPSRRPMTRRSDSSCRKGQKTSLDLDFNVDSLFGVGSPIGLFQMLHGRTIAARHGNVSPQNVDDADIALNLLHTGTSAPAQRSGNSPDEPSLRGTISSPKCSQLYNIFHPTDPISYRLEPLISPAMSTLKPQPLPYTKKGIFGAPVAQGLSGIGARVGQSVSGLWTSLSSGIASSIIHRSLGINGEELKASNPSGRITSISTEAPLSVGAGTNISVGGVIPVPATGSTAADQGTGDDRKRKLESDMSPSSVAGQHPPTLMDTQIETLYAGFQKRRKSYEADSTHAGKQPDWPALEEKARKLKDEESKVRALNANGRVDYSIQEGVFDISLIASIASHLSYWADEDVSHFILSQLLSRQRAIDGDRRPKSDSH